MGDMPHIALMSKTVTVQSHDPFTQKQMSGKIAVRHWSIEYCPGENNYKLNHRLRDHAKMMNSVLL